MGSIPFTDSNETSEEAKVARKRKRDLNILEETGPEFVAERRLTRRVRRNSIQLFRSSLEKSQNSTEEQQPSNDLFYCKIAPDLEVQSHPSDEAGKVDDVQRVCDPDVQTSCNEVQKDSGMIFKYSHS